MGATSATLLAACLWANGVPPQAAAVGPPKTSPRDLVVEALAPHGFWSSLPDHGLVWRPSRTEVGPDFVPFVSGGRWLKTERGTIFASRWPWGRVVFESGSWTSVEEWGWVWIPPPGGDAIANLDTIVKDPYPLPPLMPSIKIRSIHHPEGIDFAYPLGVQWGRRLPPGTQVRFPAGQVGSENDQMILIPEAQLRAPVFRYQALPH